MTISSTSSDKHELIAKAEDLVKEHMKQYDPSHDWYHVNRVRNTALKIAATLSPTPDLLVVELAALFHDMADLKYVTSTSPSLSELLAPVLSTPLITDSQRAFIFDIIPHVSWSTEKKLRAKGEWVDDVTSGSVMSSPELWCVQDGDRLDAIGAFGILRCAAYSSATSRPLHVPFPPLSDKLTTEQAEEISNSAIQHFYDKLLLIRTRIKTDEGKKMAERRHETMVGFLEDLGGELGQVMRSV